MYSKIVVFWTPGIFSTKILKFPESLFQPYTLIKQIDYVKVIGYKFG